jgi:hypothetical protein
VWTRRGDGQFQLIADTDNVTNAKPSRGTYERLPAASRQASKEQELGAPATAQLAEHARW